MSPSQAMSPLTQLIAISYCSITLCISTFIYLFNLHYRNSIVIITELYPITNNSKIDYMDDYESYLLHNPQFEFTFNNKGGDNILYSNPVFNKQCRNAIIDKENINITNLL